MHSLFFPLKKTTLLIPNTGPSNDIGRAHLFIILTDPCENKENLVVPICSIRGNSYDRTCILKKNDHSFVVHDSYVLYFQISRRKSETLSQKVNDGTFEYRGLIEEELFNRISEGLERSVFTPPWALEYYKRES